MGVLERAMKLGERLDGRQQEVFEKMNVLSSNGLDIQLEASAWFQPR